MHNYEELQLILTHGPNVAEGYISIIRGGQKVANDRRESGMVETWPMTETNLSLVIDTRVGLFYL